MGKAEVGGSALPRDIWVSFFRKMARIILVVVPDETKETTMIA